MEPRLIASAILIGIGCFFVAVGAIGIIRFPDFYTRMHPAGKGDTLGQALILLGLVVHEGLTLVSVKLLLIVAFIFVANPTATHAVAKAAYISGLKPWEKGEPRDPQKTMEQEEGQ